MHNLPDGRSCNRCGKYRALYEFSRSKGGMYGRRSICKECDAAYYGREYVPPLPDVPEGYRRCSHCQQVLPETTDHFYVAKGRKSPSGWQGYCKACASSKHAEYREVKGAELADYKAKWYQETRPLRLEVRRKGREKRLEQERAYKRKYHWDNRGRMNAASTQYFIDHPEYRREYRARNKELFRTVKLRRRARVNGLPNTLTTAEWQRALDYFGNCCAICERPTGLWHTLAADHWIPLDDDRADNPGTVATNIIPLCHGQSGCNNSKGAKDPEVWLAQTFSKRKAKQILVKINAYFQWVKEQV